MNIEAEELTARIDFDEERHWRLTITDAGGAVRFCYVARKAFRPHALDVAMRKAGYCRKAYDHTLTAKAYYLPRA